MARANATTNQPDAHGRMRFAFTLVEVLVVVAIIAILLLIMVPVLARARERGKVAATASTINSLCIAIDAYKTDMGRIPRPNVGNGVSPSSSNCTYGFCVLAQALVGFRDASGSTGSDSVDGFGFRLETTGRVYGPYMTPSARNYRVYRTQNDLPNPLVPTTGTRESTWYNQGFIDAWGQPLFYWSGNAQTGAQGQTEQNLFCALGNNTQNNRDYVFGDINPDAAASVTYTVNGQAIQSRLVAYTPPARWNTATTPWGAALALDGDRNATANPIPGLQFRALIGMSDPTSPTAKSTDRIVGRNSFLLVSAGRDNQYFTGDEVINESAR